MSKVVFVGNVPYNMTEEQLVGIFKSVGQVIGFRLVFDRDTAKPKGYGFCEFADHETALSAVRNLNNTDCGGRPLRIDLADSDPFLEGKTTVRGEILDGGYPGPSEPRSHWRGGSGRSHANDPEAFLANVPPGIKVPPGTTVLDSISRTLATMPPGQLMEVLAQMKAFVITHPDQARTLLVKHPQLSYALFQALLLNRIVDQNILERMLASSRGTAPAAPMQPPPQPAPVLGNRPPVPSLPPHLQQYPPQMPPFPPQGMHPQQPMQPMGPMQMTSPPPGAMFPPHQPQLAPPVPPPGQQGYYDRPPMAQVPVQAPPPPVAQPQQQQKKVVIPPNVPEQQRAMIMQVLSMSQEQIDALAQNEKNAIMQLRSQFMGT